MHLPLRPREHPISPSVLAAFADKSDVMSWIVAKITYSRRNGNSRNRISGVSGGDYIHGEKSIVRRGDRRHRPRQLRSSDRNRTRHARKGSQKGTLAGVIVFQDVLIDEYCRLLAAHAAACRHAGH
jgi:hypothetical protein